MISEKVKLYNQSNNPYIISQADCLGLRGERQCPFSFLIKQIESNGIKIVNNNRTAILNLHYCLWLTSVSTLTTQHTKVSGRMKCNTSTPDSKNATLSPRSCKSSLPSKHPSSSILQEVQKHHCTFLPWTILLRVFYKLTNQEP